jgi:hypothetical protein
MWNAYLNTELLFTSTSNFVDLNDQAFQFWDFSHTDPTGDPHGMSIRRGRPTSPDTHCVRARKLPPGRDQVPEDHSHRAG